MDGTPSVVAVPQRKPLSGIEKFLAGLLVVLGLGLIVGTLVWYGISTDGSGLVSKETKTTEPVGQAKGTKVVTETDYADTIIIFALTIGAGVLLSGAFFSRLKEVKLGAATLVMQEAPEAEVKKAVKKAKKVAGENAETDKEKAETLAGQIAEQQVTLAYFTAPPDAKASIADVVGEAAGKTAAATVTGTSSDQ